mgnify:CR=1 FL=1
MASSTTIPPPTAGGHGGAFALPARRAPGRLPQEFRGWVDHGDQGEALLSYALNNEAHQQGFFSRNLVREIIYSLITPGMSRASWNNSSRTPHSLRRSGRQGGGAVPGVGQ